MITKSKTGLAELMRGYTASEIAEFLASEEKLLQEVETASAKKKKEATQAKCIAQKDSIYSEVSRLRGMVQQYQELLHRKRVMDYRWDRRGAIVNGNYGAS